MADREVTATRKDCEGNITALCNPSEMWSPRLRSDAILDIEYDLNHYFVVDKDERIRIIVENGIIAKYIRSDPGKTKSNLLIELPDG